MGWNKYIQNHIAKCSLLTKNVLCPFPFSFFSLSSKNRTKSPRWFKELLLRRLLRSYVLMKRERTMFLFTSGFKNISTETIKLKLLIQNFHNCTKYMQEWLFLHFISTTIQTYCKAEFLKSKFPKLNSQAYVSQTVFSINYRNGRQFTLIEHWIISIPPSMKHFKYTKVDNINEPRFLMNYLPPFKALFLFTPFRSR